MISKMSLTYRDPLIAVFMRTLAWEINEAERKDGGPLVKELVTDQVQTAPEDLELQRNSAGAPYAFIQKLRKLTPALISCDPTQPLEKGWSEADKIWRLFCLPRHRLVRMLSNKIIASDIVKQSDYVQLCLKLRAPASPTLLVTIGNRKPTQKELSAPKGVYFLRLPKELYIGQSEEFATRWTGHTSKSIKWWVFIAPKDQQGSFSRDSLDAAEALLISFWNETCFLANRQRGKDKKPSPMFLQQAILFIEAASAALLWLIRERNDVGFTPWEMPFKPLRGRQGSRWPKCYLSPENKIPAQH